MLGAGSRINPAVWQTSTSLPYIRRLGRSDPTSFFGVDVHVGPKGAGKSLLAVYRALYVAKWTKTLKPGECPCGDYNCVSDWKVYTNMKSTHIGAEEAEGKGWAYPLDMAEALLDIDSKTRHAVFFIDEAYQAVDSRRTQSTQALNITDKVTQARKLDVLMLMTGVSFDALDKRIREQVRKVYNCWTPNKGQTVYAVVTTVSMPHLPPWIRSNPPSKIMRWPTGSVQQAYNTKERINMREELKALSGARQVMITDETGRVVIKEVSSIIDDILYRKALGGESRVSVDTLTETLLAAGMPVTRRYVEESLYGAGFVKDEASNEFVIASRRSYSDVLDIVGAA